MTIDNLSQFRLSQDFDDFSPTEEVKVVTNIGRPEKLKFFRTHPDPSKTFRAFLLEKKEENAFYLIHPSLMEEFIEDIPQKLLVITMDRDTRDLGLWPLNSSPENKNNSWNLSALRVVMLAREKWVRLRSNSSASSYSAYATKKGVDEPQWPEIDIVEFVAKAFGDNLISDANHPVLEALR